MDNNETINILCATDENYAPYCGIMLTSLFDSNRDCHFNVYVFIDGNFSDTNKEKYYRLGQKYKNAINLMKIDNSMIEAFPMTSYHITRPTYYRLLVTELLPINIHRVLYLDCDLIVVGDIKSLWNVDLCGGAIAGVSECTPDCHCSRLEYPVTFGYFNAGVMVIDLDYWRENKTFEKLCMFSSQSGSKLELYDQDILNGYLFDKKQLLPARFNFIVGLYYASPWNSFTKEKRDYYHSECSKVVIIHYAGPVKPWNYKLYGGPFLSEWEKYRWKSLWRDCRDIKPLKKHIRYMVKRYLFSGLFRKQHSGWVLVPENERFFK